MQLGSLLAVSCKCLSFYNRDSGLGEEGHGVVEWKHLVDLFTDWQGHRIFSPIIALEVFSATGVARFKDCDRLPDCTRSPGLFGVLPQFLDPNAPEVPWECSRSSVGTLRDRHPLLCLGRSVIALVLTDRHVPLVATRQ